MYRRVCHEIVTKSISNFAALIGLLLAAFTLARANLRACLLVLVANLVFASSAFAQAVWTGNNNGDAFYSSVLGRTVVYPNTNAWETNRLYDTGVIVAPGNWTTEEYPNSPTTNVVIPTPIPGKSYPPTLSSAVSVGNLIVQDDAWLKLSGGHLTAYQTARVEGTLELVGGWVSGGPLEVSEDGQILVDNGAISGNVDNDGRIAILPGSALRWDDAHYSGGGKIVAENALMRGTITVESGTMTIANSELAMGAPGYLFEMTNYGTVNLEQTNLSISGTIRNAGVFFAGSQSSVAQGYEFDNTGGVLFVEEGGKFVVGGRITGGTLHGNYRVSEGAFAGVINNQGVIGFAGEGHRNILRGVDVVFQNGTISGAEPGLITGTITTDDVKFEAGQIALGSWGWGGVAWTNQGNSNLHDIDMTLVTGTVANRGSLMVGPGASFSGSIDNAGGVFGTSGGGTAILSGLIGGTLTGKIEAYDATFSGAIDNQGVIGFADLGDRKFIRGTDAVIQGGTISGIVPGFLTGTITTDGVAFEGGLIALGSFGWGGVTWTNQGNTVLLDTDVSLVTGTVINRGSLVVGAGASYRGSLDNTGGTFATIDGGRAILGGVIKEGTLSGNVDCYEATLFGSISNEGVIGYADLGDRRIIRGGTNAVIHGGAISGTVPGTLTGTLTTDGVTFEGGQIALGSWGWGGVNLTYTGHTSLRDIEMYVVTGSVTNRGVFEIEEDAVFSGGIQSEIGARLIIDGIWNVNQVNLGSAELTGNGLIKGTLLNSSGTVAPGSSPGTLRIGGTYSQTQDGKLALEIGGTAAGEYDQLVVGGNLWLSGEVQLSFINGFSPSVGDTFNLFQVGGNHDLRGANFHWLNAPSGLTYDGKFVDGSYMLSITAVPEPSSLALAGIAFCTVIAFSRSRHSALQSKCGLRPEC